MQPLKADHIANHAQVKADINVTTHRAYSASPESATHIPIQHLPTDFSRQPSVLKPLASQRVRRIWLRICIAFFLATGLYGIILGGHVQRVGASLTAGFDAIIRDIGFRIERVNVVGGKNIDVAEVKNILQTEQISLLNFDTKQARERVEALPWVRRAHVLRLFPSTVKVTIEERIPYAIWQNEGKHYWIDQEGIAVTQIKLSKLPPLTLLVGKGAETAAKDLFANLKVYPDFKNNISIAFRVAERRWTLRLKNEVEIWLPADNLKVALTEIARLAKSYDIFSGKMKHIDMRLTDRITLRKAEL
ncbi:MAG: FtsQ-type POTRA domain-containing protein [Pseudomonadota bacterium]